MCQHHANVASVKAVDQIELNGISSWALRSHCARLLNFCCLLTSLSLLVTQHVALMWLDVLFKAEHGF